MKTAYYLITVKPQGNNAIAAVRELEEQNIDLLWNLYEMKARGVYRELEYFNIVLISCYCQEALSYEKKKDQYGHPQDPDKAAIDNLTARKSKAGQASKKPGPSLLERMRANNRNSFQEGTDPEPIQ